MATNYRKDYWVKSQAGSAVSGAQLFLCQQPANVPSTLKAGTPSPLQTVYADSAGLIPVSQPILTDGFGHAAIYALSGFYTVLVYFSGVLQQQYPDQLF